MWKKSITFRKMTKKSVNQYWTVIDDIKPQVKFYKSLQSALRDAVKWCYSTKTQDGKMWGDMFQEQLDIRAYQCDNMIDSKINSDAGKFTAAIYK